MISCIMAVKNIRSGIRKEITDITFPIFEQLPNCEIIVSDYASTDDTKEFIQSFNFKYIYTKPNKREKMNLAKAMNNGFINKVSCNIVVVITPDIIYSKNMPYVIEKTLKIPNSIARYRLHNIDKDTLEIGTRGGVHPIFGYLWGIRKQWIFGVRGWDERLNCHREDRDIMNRIFQKYKPKVIKTENIVALHITHLVHVGLMEGMDRSYARRILTENLKTRGKNRVNSYW